MSSPVILSRRTVRNIFVYKRAQQTQGPRKRDRKTVYAEEGSSLCRAMGWKVRGKRVRVDVPRNRRHYNRVLIRGGRVSITFP